MNVEMWPIDKLKPYPKNPRKISDNAINKVMGSLREFGFRQPIVVDKEGVIIVGHTRWMAAKKLGLAEVPVHVAQDMTPEQIAQYRIADNKLGELTTWDDDLLIQELKSMREHDIDLEVLGFKMSELEKMLGAKGTTGLTDADDLPDEPKECSVRMGDIWKLGDHKLMCGDSTKAETYKMLMGDERATMMFTDPPWNVAIGQNPVESRHRETLENDDLSDVDFEKFLDAFIEQSAPYVDGDIYVVLASRTMHWLSGAMYRRGFHHSGTIIWVKDRFVLTRCNYQTRFEPIWYGWSKKKKSSFCGRRDLDDVWEVPRPQKSDEHPTMKPVELMVRAVMNSSKPGDLVLEPFSGSGATIISCEQTGRRCYAVDLSPTFTEVGVRRWEKFTGRKAELIQRL